MKCKILFSGRNKKTIINLLSAEFALRVVKVNFIFWIIQFLIALDKMSIQLIFFFFFLFLHNNAYVAGTLYKLEATSTDVCHR